MTMITESRAELRPLTATGFFASIAQAFSSYRRNRRMLAALRGMDEHILRDIGLTQSVVMQAAAAEPGTDRLAILNRARANIRR